MLALGYDAGVAHLNFFSQTFTFIDLQMNELE